MKRIGTWLLALLLALSAAGLGVTMGAVALAWDRTGSLPMHLVKDTVNTLGNLACRGASPRQGETRPVTVEDDQESGISLE